MNTNYANQLKEMMQEDKSYGEKNKGKQKNGFNQNKQKNKMDFRRMSLSDIYAMED